MKIAVDISLYPLDADFVPPIADVIERLNSHDKLEIWTNAMSTQIVGEFEPSNPKSSMLNEHTTIVFRDEEGREIMMRQIAGALARRIICEPSPGQRINQGDHIGMIKFGSRVDLLLPVDADIMVKIGDKTCGTHTLIAKFK